jgi:hypothetical protein
MERLSPREIVIVTLGENTLAKNLTGPPENY